MSDAPETIWAQCSAHQNWDDLNASRHKVDWWHEYTCTDLTIRRDDPALVALVEAARISVAHYAIVHNVPVGMRTTGMAVMEKLGAALATFTARMEGGA